MGWCSQSKGWFLPQHPILQPLFTLRVFPLLKVSSLLLHLPLMITPEFILVLWGKNMYINEVCAYSQAGLSSWEHKSSDYVHWLWSLVPTNQKNLHLKGAMLPGIAKSSHLNILSQTQSQFYFRPGLFYWDYVNKCIYSLSAKQVPSQSKLNFIQFFFGSSSSNLLNSKAQVLSFKFMFTFANFVISFPPVFLKFMGRMHQNQSSNLSYWV